MAKREETELISERRPTSFSSAIRSGCQHCCSRPPAARSEFGRVNMLACKRVLAPLLLSVEGHCHDAAHDACMALPPYTRIREGEAPQLGRGPNPAGRAFELGNALIILSAWESVSLSTDFAV